MKVVCISDTHLQHDFQVPEGDLLLHAGDATWIGSLPEVNKFAEWFSAFPHKHKIFVAGNHDWGFEKEPALFRQLLESRGITYLEDSGIEIDGFKIWGSPWQPEFNHWAFNLSRYEGELAEKWAMIPEDTDILVTHCPPRHILDKTMAYESVMPDGIRYDPPRHVGCNELRTRLPDLGDLKLHVFGHIHAAYGMDILAGTCFVNASICNEKYKPVNAPMVIEL